jgi:hypothetical protein
MSQQSSERPSGPPSDPAQQRRLEELIAAQGVGQTATFERLFGSAKDLWADDAEFEAFLRHVEDIRREKD